MASSEAHRRGNAAAARASSVPWNDPNVDPPEDSADCPAPRWSIVSPRTRFAGRSDRSGGSSSVKSEARRAAATAPPRRRRARRGRTCSEPPKNPLGRTRARRPRESVVVPRERLGVGVGGDLEPEVRERGRRPPPRLPRGDLARVELPRARRLGRLALRRRLNSHRDDVRGVRGSLRRQRLFLVAAGVGAPRVPSPGARRELAALADDGIGERAHAVRLLAVVAPPHRLGAVAARHARRDAPVLAAHRDQTLRAVRDEALAPVRGTLPRDRTLARTPRRRRARRPRGGAVRHHRRGQRRPRRGAAALRYLRARERGRGRAPRVDERTDPIRGDAGGAGACVEVGAGDDAEGPPRPRCSAVLSNRARAIVSGRRCHSAVSHANPSEPPRCMLPDIRRAREAIPGRPGEPDARREMREGAGRSGATVRRGRQSGAVLQEIHHSLSATSFPRVWSHGAWESAVCDSRN